MPLRRNRFVTWIAAFAVVVQALWPLLSHAQPKNSSLLVPVCTINGISHYIDLKTGEAPLEKRTTLSGEHCKLCAFNSDRATALPAGPVVPFEALDLVVEQSSSLPVPLPEPLNHPPAQPRAPPQSF